MHGSMGPEDSVWQIPSFKDPPWDVFSIFMDFAPFLGFSIIHVVGDVG